MKNFKFIIILSSILFVSCEITTNTTDYMVFINECSDTVVVAFTFDNKVKDTVFMNNKGTFSGFTLSDFKKGDEGIDESTFLAHANNLTIYRIKNNDTLFMNKEKYNNIKAWNKSIQNDMAIKITRYELTITDDMFK
ncbi:MAG: hypothetical protein PHC83_09715 [Bacteroidales bacterium]|jgi:translation elongation factor P/translation initiation factor 5A|nr:hypothetical protein [Bacteroidales bacterium]MDD4210171.1 hypothetical protein [Bacteroidales bacterium]